MSEKWDKRFMDMACLVASWSKDPHTQVGAVIVRPNRTIASVGFNGFPQRMKDDEHLYTDRVGKQARMVHAEMNALHFCSDNPTGMTLYTYPFQPCNRCAVEIIQAGIVRVVSFKYMPERWEESMKTAASYFDEASVELVLL
jgi:dCMP deaminase